MQINPRELFDSIEEFILVLGSEGRILHANRTVLERLGYTAEELLEQKCVVVHPPQEREEAAALMREAMAGKSSFCAIPVMAKDGRVIPVKTKITRGRWSNQQVLVAISRDLSDGSQAEEAFRPAGACQRSLIEACLDPLVTISPQGKISDVNTATELITGCSRTELIGSDFCDYFTQPKKAREGYQEVFRHGNVHDYPLDILHQDGHVTPVLYHASVLRDGAGEVVGVFAAARDITARVEAEREPDRYQQHLEMLMEERTEELSGANEQVRQEIAERKQVEAALRENEEILRGVLDALPVGVWITDKQGVIVRCNPAGRKIWEGAKYVGIEQFGEYKAWWSSTGKRIEPEEWAVARAVMKGESSLDEEIEIECFDGSHKFILNSAVPLRGGEGEITGAVFINQDITERVLREKERLLLVTAMEQSADSIYLTDTNWIIQYVNPSFEKVCGYSSAELIGQTAPVLKSGKNEDAFDEAMWKSVNSGQVWKGRFTSRKKNGDLYEVQATISPVKDLLGRIVHYVIVERDITQELQTDRHLQQTQRMEALGSLAGGIAHDFNNILGVIMGFTQLAMIEVRDGSLEKTYLEDILNASHRAKDLVTQVLAFSRKVEQSSTPLVISAVVKEALQFLKASLPSTITIRQEIAISSKAGLGMVLADPTKIHQVMMNLCTNAAHAMKTSGGTLRVRLVDVELDAGAASGHPDLKPGPYMRLTVSDTGQGIDAKTRERIFEPYFTTKQAGEGTGLGLAVVHSIVRAFNGVITVESEPGNGTTFHILLPRVEEKAPAVAISQQPIVGGTERILFVDDEEQMGRMWAMLLEPLGYRVTCKTSSLDALETFQTSPDEFDLVITDQTMPHLTGTDLASRLLNIRPDIPIILCTGFSELISDDEVKAMGIKEFLMKPLVLRSLSEAIRRIVVKQNGRQ